MSKRKLIRETINSYFVSLIYENIYFTGTPRLLQIILSIVEGAAVPLKGKHIAFFKHVIIPLYKVESFPLFYAELYKCSIVYIEKDPSLV